MNLEHHKRVAKRVKRNLSRELGAPNNVAFTMSTFPFSLEYLTFLTHQNQDSYPSQKIITKCAKEL